MILKEGIYTEVTKVVNGEQVRMHPVHQIITAMEVADRISKKLIKMDAVITAIFDGGHMIGSKHYEGKAFDMRKSNFSETERKEFFRELTIELGSDFDVVEEATHFHIEFDPK